MDIMTFVLFIGLVFGAIINLSTFFRTGQGSVGEVRILYCAILDILARIGAYFVLWNIKYKKSISLLAHFQQFTKNKPNFTKSGLFFTFAVARIKVRIFSSWLQC